MVAGKMRSAMGLQKSPANTKTKAPEPLPPNNNNNNKPPSPSPSSGNKSSSQKAVFSRSFGVYFPRSSAQVQPKPPDVAELLRVVEELRERESRLKTELLEHKLLKESAAIVPMLENEIFTKEEEIERAKKTIESLEDENKTLRSELETVRAKLEQDKRDSETKVEEMEAKMRTIASEISEMKKAAASSSSNSYSSCFESDELSSSQRFQGLMEVTVRSSLIKNLKKAGGAKYAVDATSAESHHHHHHPNKLERSDSKREVVELLNERPISHSRSNFEDFAESSSSALVNIRSRIPRVPKPPPRPLSPSADNKISATEQTAPPPPPPPPPPQSSQANKAPPPPPSRSAPPPPPPPTKGRKAVTEKVRRVPEVVEFYHSLMRRDSRRDSGGGASDALATANARDMIGEIENRSAHLLAIKTDVETQGDFIRFLIKEVENAAFTDINDVVPFVKWLDDELSYLVDERAVLKHFDWPEQKADALREAAFGYCDLKKLEIEASLFPDHSRQPCGPTLKKMQALLEKLEHGVYNLSRMRESATKRYKVFGIPTNWMLDTEFVSQIKLASVKLAMKYMKRVSAELELVGGSGPEEEELIVQGVRFAFRVHQFAGGFDAETMRAFQVLRDKVRSCHVQCQNQQQQKIVCKSTPC